MNKRERQRVVVSSGYMRGGDTQPTKWQSLSQAERRSLAKRILLERDGDGKVSKNAIRKMLRYGKGLNAETR